MNCCWEKHCLYQYYWLEDGDAPCLQGNLSLMCRYVRKDVACPRMQLFEADNEMTAITWESSQETFRHLLGFSWEEECWDSLVYFDLWADVGESCFLSPWDWPSHPSIPLCHPQSGSVPTLPAVQTCCVCKDPDDSLSCYRCHGDYSSSSGSHGSRRSQQVAGLFCHQHLDHVVPVNPSRPLSFMNVGTPSYPIIEPVPCPVPEYPPALDWQFLTGPHYWWATLGPSSTGPYSVEDEDLHNFNGSESQYALFLEAVQGSFATVTP